MKANKFLVAGVLVILAIAAYFVSYPHLAERIPLHWNIDGAVDGYGPRYALLLLGPGLMLSEMALFALLPKLSPKRYEVDSFEPTYLHLMLVLVSMSGYFFGVLLWAAWTGPVDINRALLAGISVLTILIGNVLGKVRRNFFIGVRTPWTLASERVWYATHRLAGKLAVFSGFICLLLALLGAAVWLWMTVLFAGLLTPVAYSFYYYKGLEKRGELDAPAL